MSRKFFLTLNSCHLKFQEAVINGLLVSCYKDKKKIEDYSLQVKLLKKSILHSLTELQVMKISLEQSFAEVLKDLRVKSGLSQESLAYESDLDRSFISMLERGLKQPTLTTLFTLCKALNVKPSEVIKSIEEKYVS